MNDSAHGGELNLRECAELLHVKESELRQAVRSGAFPAPATTIDGVRYWTRPVVLRWAVRSLDGAAARIELTYWPDADQPAEFLGATTDRAYGVALSWGTLYGEVAVLWAKDAIMLHLADVAKALPHAVVVVNVEPDFGVDGPSVRALNPAVADGGYSLWWRDLARTLGQPMPYWPLLMRDPGLITSWTPGAATVGAPVDTDMNLIPLLRMASLHHPSHAVHRTMLSLVNRDQLRATKSAQDDITTVFELEEREIRTNPRRDATVIAAEPIAPVGVEDPEDLDETTQRIAWLDLLSRTDTLSVQCVSQVLRWDGGKHLPFGGTYTINPTTAAGGEWARRLEPIGRTAAFECLAAKPGAETLTDPVTELPAVREPDGTITTVVAQRLATESPLAEVILDVGYTVWVRTKDGTLYLAPKRPPFGLSWGYGGGGPSALAALLDRLLDDITAPGVTDTQAPEGLRELTQTKWPVGTVLTRAQLEVARRPGHG